MKALQARSIATHCWLCNSDCRGNCKLSSDKTKTQRYKTKTRPRQSKYSLEIVLRQDTVSGLNITVYNTIQS